MRKPGKLRVEKVWAQLTNPVINSLTQFDFHVDVVVIVDIIFFCRPPCRPPCPPPCWPPCLLHVGHRDFISMLCEGSETLLEWKYESIMDGLIGVGARNAWASKDPFLCSWIP